MPIEQRDTDFHLVRAPELMQNQTATTEQFMANFYMSESDARDVVSLLDGRNIQQTDFLPASISVGRENYGASVGMVSLGCVGVEYPIHIAAGDNRSVQILDASSEPADYKGIFHQSSKDPDFNSSHDLERYYDNISYLLSLREKELDALIRLAGGTFPNTDQCIYGGAEIGPRDTKLGLRTGHECAVVYLGRFVCPQDRPDLQFLDSRPLWITIGQPFETAKLRYNTNYFDYETEIDVWEEFFMPLLYKERGWDLPEKAAIRRRKRRQGK